LAYKDILYSEDDGVATVTLNRPHVLNALSPTMFGELVKAIENAKHDNKVRVLVITGAGRGFCSGADLNILTSGQAFQPQRLVRAFATFDKPYIASVNGPAVGGGFGLTTFADLRIASDRAVFSMNHLRVAGLSEDGGYYFLSRILGVARTLELVLTCRLFDAREALQIGYISRVVPHADLADATRELAAKLAAGPPITTRLVKRLIYESTTVSLEKHLEDADNAWHLNEGTEDVKEGRQAFLEKRQPYYKGK
jgi:2-(1,2-epoxy-1,2-dihydrophenyl)acetyl-CoA isomerase